MPVYRYKGSHDLKRRRASRLRTSAKHRGLDLYREEPTAGARLIDIHISLPNCGRGSIILASELATCRALLGAVTKHLYIPPSAARFSFAHMPLGHELYRTST